MKKRIRLVGIFLLFAFLIAAGYVLLQLWPMASDSPAQVSFSVEEGEYLGAIANRLEEQGLIRSSFFLKIFSRVRSRQLDYKPGDYLLSPAMSLFEIEEALIEGRRELMRVTFSEGLTVRRYAEILEESGITDGDSFLQAVRSPRLLDGYGIAGDSAEGFLFPDTYLFEKGYPAEKVADFLVASFFDRLEEIAPEYVEFGEDKLYETVVLASIVEREYFVAEEAPLMASVFRNRIAQNYRLQSCATVGYVIAEIQGEPYPTRLFYEDLEIDSPFNTYVYRGYPPAPIANPGAVALDAAFHNPDSDYLYFVRTPDGSGAHVFSTNYRDHSRAATEYILKLDGES